jgi:hypothetical protein
MPARGSECGQLAVGEVSADEQLQLERQPLHAEERGAARVRALVGVCRAPDFGNGAVPEWSRAERRGVRGGSEWATATEAVAEESEETEAVVQGRLAAAREEADVVCVVCAASGGVGKRRRLASRSGPPRACFAGAEPASHHHLHPCSASAALPPTLFPRRHPRSRICCCAVAVSSVARAL